jgi:hypothetical protein
MACGEMPHAKNVAQNLTIAPKYATMGVSTIVDNVPKATIGMFWETRFLTSDALTSGVSFFAPRHALLLCCYARCRMCAVLHCWQSVAVPLLAT